MPIVLCTYLVVRLVLSWESMQTRFGDGRMKGKFDTYEQQEANASMTVRASNKTVARKRTTATAESPRQSKKTISKGKSVSCPKDFQTIPFSRMLGLDSISNENNCSSCSKNVQWEESEKSLLPTETDFADLDLNCLSGSSLRTLLNSWFSNNKNYRLNKNWLQTCSPSSPSFHVEFTDSENTVTRSRKIRVYPNKEQRTILDRWFGASRFSYNKTVEFLKHPDTKAQWKSIKTDLMHDMPEWSKEVPYQIKSVAIRDCCQAVSNAKKKFKQTGKFQEVKFRSKKRGDNNLFIPQTAVSENGVYYTILGKLKTAEPLWKPVHDCRMVLQNGRYFVIVPIDVAVKRPENQRLSACALDCGVRTFQTIFSKELILKVGEHDFQRIFRYCYALDKLVSRKKKERSNKFNKAMQRIRWKVRDLIDEIHNKLALTLCRTFDVVYIPTFETHDMVSKLKHNTSRAMLGWAHYRFKMKLKSKAEEYSCQVVDCTEEYTSKTCGNCGEISSIGGKEVWTCKHCSCVHDRDINGARNILFKQMFLALRDSSTPCLV